jgi:hypothetical protein
MKEILCLHQFAFPDGDSPDVVPKLMRLASVLKDSKRGIDLIIIWCPPERGNRIKLLVRKSCTNKFIEYVKKKAEKLGKNINNLDHGDPWIWRIIAEKCGKNSFIHYIANYPAKGGVIIDREEIIYISDIDFDELMDKYKVTDHLLKSIFR